MPNSANPGYAFTEEKFLGEGEMPRALARAEEHVRQAYARMEVPPEFELYDLSEDPFEFRNLAEDPAHSEAFAELRAVLAAWREETRDPFLDPANVARLKAEVDATFKNGQPEKPDGWAYFDYLTPEVAPWMENQ